MRTSSKISIGVIIPAGIAAGIYFARLNRGTEINVKQGPVQESIYGLGKVKSDQVFEFKLGVVSSIKKVFVREGDTVQKGQRLLEFDGTDPLNAPFSGVVVSRPFNERENVFPQLPILRLEDLTQRFVEVALEQQGALRVKKGQTARFSFESFRGQIFLGTVESVYPSRDQFFVRIQSKELPESVLPGMTADVAIEVGHKSKVVLIPSAALTSGRVLRLRDGRRDRVEVKVGITDGEWTEVESGDIVASDKIVVPNRR